MTIAEDGHVVPRTAQEFGAGLAALRGKRGFRTLEQSQVGGRPWLSKSSLERFEKGQLPKLEYAQHLDRLYDAGGWVELALRSLWRSQWDPWRRDHGSLQAEHFGIWPAPYRGVVWVKLKPHRDRVGRSHHIECSWGPWRHRGDYQLPAEGLVLTTGKSEDPSGVPVTFNVVSDHPLFALFGAGEDLGGDQARDIRHLWSRE